MRVRSQKLLDSSLTEGLGLTTCRTADTSKHCKGDYAGAGWRQPQCCSCNQSAYCRSANLGPVNLIPGFLIHNKLFGQVNSTGCNKTYSARNKERNESEMAAAINVLDWVVQHIAVPVQRLRIARIGDDGVRAAVHE